MKVTIKSLEKPRVLSAQKYEITIRKTPDGNSYGFVLNDEQMACLHTALDTFVTVRKHQDGTDIDISSAVSHLHGERK